MQTIDDLMERLLEASRSFRKKSGRHVLRTEDVAYCAFSTPGFSVPRELAQRDAARRLTRFGLDRSQVEGRTVLDLGCNAGAMLFELTNRGVLRGRGIEFDLDKVELAREISKLSQLTQLQFEQGDLDRLDAAALGRFDIVLALAIESHVLDQERLLALLAQVTGHVLCFEGNAGCDIRAIGAKLLQLGFDGIEYLGTCDDDVRAANNRRPLLKAWRTRRRSSSRVSADVGLSGMRNQSEAEVATHAAAALGAEAAMEMSGLRYARGFCFSKVVWERAPQHWGCVALVGGWLQWDRRVELAIARADGFTIAILGRAVDLIAGDAQLSVIARRLLDARKRSICSMQDAIEGLSGRFVVIDAEGDRVRIQQDAAGMRTVYYTSGAPICGVASHERLLVETCGGRELSRFGGVWSDIEVLQGAYGYPGRATGHAGIFALTPNTALDLHGARIERIFPVSGPGSMRAEDAAELLTFLFQRQLELLAQGGRLVLSLTSGLDSRVTLAAAKNLLNDIRMFTYSPATKASDIEIPCAIADRFGIDHRMLALRENKDFPPGFRQAIFDNCPRPHVHSAALAYIRTFKQDDLHIRSNHYEIGRAFYMKHRPKNPVMDAGVMQRRLLEKGGRGSETILAEFEDWISATAFPFDSGYLPQDIFYWEHRMGRWCAPNLCESDVAFDTWAVVNSRLAYRAMLSVPFEDRVKGTVFLEIIRRAWPQLLDFPVNGVLHSSVAS